MALADTGKAIGAVSRLLVERLTSRTTLHVQVSRPDSKEVSAVKERLNLFLYEVLFDANLKNTSLDDGQPAPLWMTLRYLLTAYDEAGESDTDLAHNHLGEACRALQEYTFLQVRDTDADIIRKPLVDNPDELRITFIDASSDLLSKVMQGTDERYRCSVAFEIRPVMIAPAVPPSYSLLVGVDYTQAPPATIGLAGVQVAAIPSLGPAIDEVSPTSFEVGQTLTIYGSELHLTGLSVQLGPVELPVTAQSPSWLKCVLRPDLVHGGVISAGGQPVTVLNTLPSGRVRRSNMGIGDLMPRLDSVAIISKTIIPATMTEPARAYGDIDLTGLLLGTAADDVYVALYRNGRTVRLFDVLVDQPGPPQTVRRLSIASADAVPVGTYVVLLRINGVQARSGLSIELVP
jgi:hypothetical protein